jgi:hypothetical protein
LSYGEDVTIEIKKPELEALLDELQKSGANLEEVLLDTLSAHRSKPEKTVKYQRAAGKKSLVEVFAQLRGMDLDFGRNSSTGRPVDL